MTNRAKFSDRIRFNWGYHDAAADSQHGHPRQVVDNGPQSLRVVSSTFDRAYASGYRAGLEDVKSGAYVGNSDSAWKMVAHLAKLASKVGV
jgi:hypothetical protein